MGKVFLGLSVLLNLGFVFVLVVQPLPRPGSWAASRSREHPPLDVAAMSDRLSAAGFSPAEIEKIVAAANPAAESKSESAEAGTPPPAEGAEPAHGKSTSLGGYRNLSLGTTVPAAINAAPRLVFRDRATNSALRANQSAPVSAAAAAAASAAGPNRNPATSLEPLVPATTPPAPSASAPARQPETPAKPQVRALTAEQELYRSRYGWQNFNAAVTETALQGGLP
jgi:hypothetical protein